MGGKKADDRLTAVRHSFLAQAASKGTQQASLEDVGGTPEAKENARSVGVSSLNATWCRKKIQRCTPIGFEYTTNISPNPNKIVATSSRTRPENSNAAVTKRTGHIRPDSRCVMCLCSSGLSTRDKKYYDKTCLPFRFGGKPSGMGCEIRNKGWHNTRVVAR